MSLIDVIPVGKKHRETRETLMYKAKINNVETFKKEMELLRKQYIILYDDGYYVPASKEEYEKLISKLEGQCNEIQNTINLANKEMEKKGYDKTE